MLPLALPLGRIAVLGALSHQRRLAQAHEVAQRPFEVSTTRTTTNAMRGHGTHTATARSGFSGILFHGLGDEPSHGTGVFFGLEVAQEVLKHPARTFGDLLTLGLLGLCEQAHDVLAVLLDVAGPVSLCEGEPTRENLYLPLCTLKLRAEFGLFGLRHLAPAIEGCGLTVEVVLPGF